MGAKHQQAQWKLVEHVVAALFDSSDVEVESNVRLPAIRRRGGARGRREIDVLVTGRLAGQRIHVAIECKHLGRKVGSPEIDAFIGKLADVGLPTQTSIFVSTSGFSDPAVARAREVGLRTLILSGTDLSRSRHLLLEAIQSQIYVGCQVTRLEFLTDGPFEERDLLFFDQGGGFKGCLPDLLWQAWLNGRPPLICGRHCFEVKIPAEWMFHEDGSQSSTRDIHVEYKVFALIQQREGHATWHRLTDAYTKTVERQKVKVAFGDAPLEAIPQAFECEEDLSRYLSSRPGNARVTVGRLRLPKLVTNEGLLWPVPASAIESVHGMGLAEAGDEAVRFRESAANNYWNFDGVYAGILEQAQTGCWIEMIPAAARSGP